MGLNLTRKYSINFNSHKRSYKSVKFIIIHYTGMRNQNQAIKKLCKFGSKVSAHYFIKNDGALLNLVPDLYVAWHAGKSSWKKISFLNKCSIGIEINNAGHDHNYIKFKEKQIFTLKKLLKKLIKKYKIKNCNILGHSDISPDRKKDPGEKFPWKKLAKNGLSIWHDLNENKILAFRNQKIDFEEQIIFIKNLEKIGYSKKVKNKVFIIKGYFKESLKTNQELKELNKIKFAHIDCDLYISAVEPLDYLIPRLANGAYLMIDDFTNIDPSGNSIRNVFLEKFKNHNYQITGYFGIDGVVIRYFN